MVKVHRSLFCELAIEAGFLTRNAMVEALKIQYELTKKQQHTRIGTICAEKGFMSVPQVLTILEMQNVFIYECSACGKQYNIAFANPHLNYYCLRDDERLIKVVAENARSVKVDGVIHYSMGFPGGSSPDSSGAFSPVSATEENKVSSGQGMRNKFNVKQAQLDSDRLKKLSSKPKENVKKITRSERVQLDSKILAAMVKGEKSASLRKTSPEKSLTDREFEVLPEKIDPAQINAYKYIKTEIEENTQPDYIDPEFKEKDIIIEENIVSPTDEISSMVLKAVDRVERQLSSLESEELKSDAFEIDTDMDQQYLADDAIDSDRMILMESVQSEFEAPMVKDAEKLVAGEMVDSDDEIEEEDTDEEKIDTEMDLIDEQKKEETDDEQDVLEEIKADDDLSWLDEKVEELETPTDSTESEEFTTEDLSWLDEDKVDEITEETDEEPVEHEDTVELTEELKKDDDVESTETPEEKPADEEDVEFDEIDESLLRKKAVIQISNEDKPSVDVLNKSVDEDIDIDDSLETTDSERIHLKQVMSEILSDDVIEKIQESDADQKTDSDDEYEMGSEEIENLTKQLESEDLEDSNYIEKHKAETELLDDVEEKQAEVEEEAKEEADADSKTPEDIDESPIDQDLTEIQNEEYFPPETEDTEFTISRQKIEEDIELDEINESDEEHIPPSDNDTLLEIKYQEELMEEVADEQTEDAKEDSDKEDDDEDIIEEEDSKKTTPENLKSESADDAVIDEKEVESQEMETTEEKEEKQDKEEEKEEEKVEQEEKEKEKEEKEEPKTTTSAKKTPAKKKPAKKSSAKKAPAKKKATKKEPEKKESEEEEPKEIKSDKEKTEEKKPEKKKTPAKKTPAKKSSAKKTPAKKKSAKKKSAKSKAKKKSSSKSSKKKNELDTDEGFDPETETMEVYPDFESDIIEEEEEEDSPKSSESEAALNQLKSMDEEDIDREFENDTTDLRDILKEGSTEMYFREANDYEDIEFDIDALDEMLSKDLEEDLDAINESNQKSSILSKVMLDDSQLERTDIIEIPERFNIAKKTVIGPPDDPYEEIIPDVEIPKTGINKLVEGVKDSWVTFVKNVSEDDEIDDE